jgi:arylsulfatase A-like enzyme
MARTPETPPNVVLIVVDTLRADHLSHYGYSRNTAGPIDAFRRGATLFERAYATAPWTGPSSISIHTGLSTFRHRANHHGDRVPDEATTLAERLAEAGYATHGISFNPHVSSKTGLDRGFHSFDEFQGSTTAYPDIRIMTERVEKLFAEPPPEPFFLYLHPMNVHGPYLVPRSRRADLLGRPPGEDFVYYGEDLMAPLMRKSELELRERVTPAILESLVDKYDVAVHYSMAHIARMLETIDRSDLLEDTVVVLTADHGEELFDHGGFSHGYTLHREVLHVPLYLHRPGQATAASEDRAVSTLDIVPTVLELAGLPVPKGLDGRSLLSTAAEEPEDRVLVQQTLWSERAEGLSLIRGSEHLIDLVRSYDTPEPRLSLFHLASDPLEQVDLSQTRRDRTLGLRDRLEARLAELARETRLAAPRNALEEMNVEQLRALGYVE